MNIPPPDTVQVGSERALQHQATTAHRLTLFVRISVRKVRPANAAVVNGAGFSVNVGRAVPVQGGHHAHVTNVAPAAGFPALLAQPVLLAKPGLLVLPT